MRSLLLLLLLLFSGSVCTGQVSDEQAKVIAETATRADLNYAKSQLLRAHRREDLEDDLFRFQIKPEGKIAKAAYFYEVSKEGYFILSPSEAVYVTSEDGHMVRLVAISIQTGEAYLLYGSRNAALEFNRLAKDASLTITSTRDAEMYARLCFIATEDPSEERLISGPRQLRHSVEDYFFSNYPERKAEKLWRGWWSGFSSKRWNAPFDVASKNPLGYEAALAAINGSPNKIPLLNVWTLQIAPAGLCQLKSIRTIYPTKAR